MIDEQEALMGAPHIPPLANKVRHVCIVSPSHLALNPRLVKEARALRDAGLNVSVVCGRYHPWAFSNDRELARDLGSVTWVAFGPSETDRLTYLRQTLSRHLARLMARAGLWRHPAIAAIAQHPIAGDLARAVRKVRADLYIAHYVAALPAVAYAARLHRARYMFDAEDFHVGDLPDILKNVLEKRLISSIEAEHLREASAVTAAAPMIADAYAYRYKIDRPSIILNLFTRSAAPSSFNANGTVSPGPTIYWFSQTVGPGRGLEALVQASAWAATRPHLYLRGTPAAGYEHSLRTLATSVGISDRIHFLPPIAPAELERDGARFDLGYVGELAETFNRRIALTNKLFSFLSSGLPVLLSDIPAHEAILPDLGVAAESFPIADAVALAHAIDKMLEPSRLAVSRKAAWLLGQGRFAWESEVPRLVSYVSRVLESPCAAA